MGEPIVTSVRKFDNSPAPRRDGAPRPIAFNDLRYQAHKDAEHQRIWRDDLKKRAEESADDAFKAECAQAAAARDRQAQIYDKLERMVERCANDPVLLDRLKQLQREEMADDAR